MLFLGFHSVPLLNYLFCFCDYFFNQMISCIVSGFLCFNRVSLSKSVTVKTVEYVPERCH